MNPTFCLPPLMMSAERSVRPLGNSSVLPSRQHAISPSGHDKQGHAVLQRKPVVGEALIDVDGVVWLVDALEKADGGYVTNVSRVTLTQPEDLAPNSYRLCKVQFEDFCRTRGILLR